MEGGRGKGEERGKGERGKEEERKEEGNERKEDWEKIREMGKEGTIPFGGTF